MGFVGVTAIPKDLMGFALDIITTGLISTLFSMLILEGIYLSGELGREVSTKEVRAASQSTAIEV